MVVLLIHHNYPAQYLHLARHLGQQAEHRVVFLTQQGGLPIAGVEQRIYQMPVALLHGCHPYNQSHEAAVRTALAVLTACRQLRQEGLRPDVIIGHTGWGELLLVKEAFPDSRVLGYFEFFYRATGLDVGYDPEFAPSRPDDGERLWLRNSINYLSRVACDAGHTATEWQRSLFPAAWQTDISVLHEGIDTHEVRPDAMARFTLADGRQLTRADEVITYVARNLEPYRGFHSLMRALPAVLRARPQAHVVVVGAEGISYGDLPPYGGSWRALLQAELGAQLDLSNVHFTGQIGRMAYLQLLQVSRLHLYLTYPFVLSWSALEALASGCLVLGSDVAPVREVITDGENGFLVDMRAPDAVAERMIALLADSAALDEVRARARHSAVSRYDLATCCLPRWLETLAALGACRA